MLAVETPTEVADAERLRQLVQLFMRRFGLLFANQTPCGQPVSPSHAHALTVLLERARERVRRSAPSNGLRQADLGTALGIDKSNVTRLCARMEEMGHVVQSRAPQDGRSRLLTLTAAGTRLARSVERTSRARFERLLERVPASRRAVVFAGLETLDAALAPPSTGATS